ncbi:MAG: NADPH-dependent 7-cyano-7-deazaguanine reductase QueF [Opitutales bacterium]
MPNKTEKIAATHLGKKSTGSLTYDPSLLVPIPRNENREQYKIDNDNLPFLGVDAWHAYEFSCLTSNGLPVTRVIKLKYNCDSEYLIESKSLKLYLNSFNMSSFGQTIDDCLEICKSIIEKDLSNALKTEVSINFLTDDTKRVQIFEEFENILNFVETNKLKIEKFKESPQLLEVELLSDEKEYYLTFDSLRSNCRVTHQPDFGDIFIYYKSNHHIKEDSLVKYLCSFRSEFHFHEECCEMIYKRLYDVLNINKHGDLFVCALYTRRGGIDICPVRWSKDCKNMAVPLIDTAQYARKSIKQ